MQLLKNILEKRRFKADDLIMGELDFMIKLISLISKSDFQEGKTQSTTSIDSILEVELEYKKHSDFFPSQITSATEGNPFGTTKVLNAEVQLNMFGCWT